MKNTYSFYLLFSFLIVGFGCNYDNKEDLFEIDPNCDTDNVTYSVDVKDILTNRCLGCHSTSNFEIIGGFINLEEFSNLKNFVGTDGSGGQFLKSIKQLSGASPMPKNGAKIPDCEIAKIEKWIENGALED